MISAELLQKEYLSAMNSFDTIQDLPTKSLEFSSKLTALISKFEECSKAIENQGIFSKNEMIEDIDTQDLKYMILRLRTPSLIEMIQSNRRDTLLYCKQLGLQMLQELEARDFKPCKGSESRPTGSDPRELKIWEFKREKELKRLINAGGDERELILMQIEIEQQKLQKLIKGVDLELEMLDQVAKKILENPGKIDNDTRIDNLDWRLDQQKALLSKEGKIMRPFVIATEFNKRREMQNGVFGERNLPTMTIEEYLDNEMARGNIIGGSSINEAEESGESEEDIYKKRAWDDFTDNNPRGWGNRHNKG